MVTIYLHTRYLNTTDSFLKTLKLQTNLSDDFVSHFCIPQDLKPGNLAINPDCELKVL